MSEACGGEGGKTGIDWEHERDVRCAMLRGMLDSLAGEDGTQQENSVGYSRSYSVLVSYSLRGGEEVSNSLQVSNHVSNISSPQRDLYEM